MRDQVNYYLDRARAAALAGTLGTLTEVEPVIAGLARTFAKIYRDKDLAVELDDSRRTCASGARSRTSRRWLGNLIDNAAKWAALKVVVAAETRARGRRSVRASSLLIDDDGPGLPESGAGRRCSSAAVASTKRSPAPASACPSSAILQPSIAVPCRLDASPLGGLRADSRTAPGTGGATLGGHLRVTPCHRRASRWDAIIRILW